MTSNLKQFRYDWTWKKSKITGVLNAKRQPVRNHESILVFGNVSTYNPQGLIKHDKVTKQGSCSNNYGVRSTEAYIQEWTNYPRSVLEIASEGKTTHPTQKPVALMEYLIRTYTNEGDTVLDNCAGSFTTAIACLNTGRRFIGIERDEGYFKKGLERVLRHMEAMKPVETVPEPPVVTAAPSYVRYAGYQQEGLFTHFALEDVPEVSNG